MAAPEVAEIFPGVITPVPLVKTGVRVVELPAVRVVFSAVSDVATGAGGGGADDPPPPPPPQANVKATRLARAIDERDLWKRLILVRLWTRSIHYTCLTLKQQN